MGLPEPDDNPAQPDGEPKPTTEEGAELDPSDEVLDGEVVDGPSRKDDSMVGAAQMLSAHSGPLPSEEWLTTVEQIAPGTTKDLVADYVTERQHQRVIQARAVEIDRENFRSFARYQNLQLLAAWSLVTMIAAGGVVLIATGHAIGGLIALVVELGVLAGVFFSRRQPNEDKNESEPTDQE